MIPYEGTKPYIFISYPHKDSDVVMPILEELSQKGFRLWYDAGIEVGTEWNQYVAEHICDAAVVLLCLSPRFDESPNCRDELAFAKAERKTIIALHLEEYIPEKGIRLQVNSLQAIFRYRHETTRSLVESLARAKELVPCCDASRSEPKPEPKPEPEPEPKPELKPEPEPKPEPKPRSQGSRRPASQGLAFRAVGDGYIVSGKGSCNDIDLVIPDTYQGKPVVGVADNAFITLLFAPKFLSVDIPDSVAYLGTNAFACCYSLKRVTMGVGTKHICESAFANCNDLDHIRYGGTVAQWHAVEKHGKWNAATPHFTVRCTDGVVGKNEKPEKERPQAPQEAPVSGANRSAEGLTPSQGLAFTALSSGNYALSGLGTCKELDVVVPATYNRKPVTEISPSAFSGIFSSAPVTGILIPDGVTVIGGNAFSGCNKLKRVALGRGLTRLEHFAFSGCSALERIDLPSGLTFIGECAFFSCHSLTRVEIPASVTTVVKSAFQNCQRLESIVFPRGLTALEKGVLFSCPSLTSVRIPDTVRRIEKDAFFGCYSLKRIRFDGYMAQWNTIAKPLNWKDKKARITIACLDGEIVE